jgi:hypothetical protein
VVDLKHALWACPLIEENKEIFAFEWEDFQANRKQQYQWTALPQRFTDFPKILGQILE